MKQLTTKPGSTWQVPDQKEIVLQRAIEIAIERGWDTTHFNTLSGSYKHPDESEFHDLLGDWHKVSPSDVIFNHNFAKALWGEGDTYQAECIRSPKEGDAGFDEYCTTWEYHLREMVISPDPIAYLGENI